MTEIQMHQVNPNQEPLSPFGNNIVKECPG